MSPLGIILIVFLLLLALGGLPAWNFHSFGYGPSSLAFVILIVVVILVLTGRL